MNTHSGPVILRAGKPRCWTCDAAIGWTKTIRGWRICEACALILRQRRP